MSYDFDLGIGLNAGSFNPDVFTMDTGGAFDYGFDPAGGDLPFPTNIPIDLPPFVLFEEAQPTFLENLFGVLGKITPLINDTADLAGGLRGKPSKYTDGLFGGGSSDMRMAGQINRDVQGKSDTSMYKSAMSAYREPRAVQNTASRSSSEDEIKQLLAALSEELGRIKV